MSPIPSLPTRTYIEPGALYEINLTDQIRTELLALPTSPPPPPGAYDAAHNEIWWLLEESLARWKKCAMPNAGWRHLAFSTYVGLFNAIITIVAMIIARVYMRGKSGRIVAGCLTPWLWFGIVGVICGLKGVRPPWHFRQKKRHAPHAFSRCVSSATVPVARFDRYRHSNSHSPTC